MGDVLSFDGVPYKKQVGKSTHSLRFADINYISNVRLYSYAIRK